MLVEKLPGILEFICSFLTLPYIGAYNLTPSVVIWNLSIKDNPKDIGLKEKAK
jgi:hypothetical protein